MNLVPLMSKRKTESKHFTNSSKIVRRIHIFLIPFDCRGSLVVTGFSCNRAWELVIKNTVITVAQGVSLAKFEDQTILVPTGCDPKRICGTRENKWTVDYTNTCRKLHWSDSGSQAAVSTNRQFVLLHSGVPVPSVTIVKRFLATSGLMEFSHPHYSSYLPPADFFMFPEVNSAFQGRRFEDFEYIKKNITA